MADLLDVITLDEAEAELGVDSDTEILLGGYITAVSRMLDKACGPIVKRAITGEAHDGGTYHIMLNEYPIYSVTSVTEYAGTAATALTEETAGTAPSPGFLSLDESGKIIRRAGKHDAAFATGRRNIVVSYEAGRYADTLSVDYRFKRAALIALANLWRKEQGMGTVTFGPDGQPVVGATYALPNAAAAFVQDDLRPTGLAS